MDAVLRFFTRQNTALFLILFMVVAAMYAVLVPESLTLNEAVNLLDQPLAALLIGGGLATVALSRTGSEPVNGGGGTLRAGEQVLGIAAVILFIYALVGFIQVVFLNELTIQEYLKLLDTPAAGLAIGKGIFANNR